MNLAREEAWVGNHRWWCKYQLVWMMS